MAIMRRGITGIHYPLSPQQKEAEVLQRLLRD
jgi:hypothetical protein